MSDPYDIAAERLLTSKIDAIRRFWDHFSAHANELDGIFSSQQGNADRVVEIMTPLAEVDSQLMWEFGPSEKGHAICITAEWRHELRATARAVVNMAPELDVFSVTDARTGNDAELLKDHVLSRFQMPVTLSTIGCKPGIDNKVEMIGTGPGSDEETGNEVLALATCLLGESLDREWFGDVETAKQKSGFFGLGRKNVPSFDPDVFKADFEAAVAEIRSSLPKVRRAKATLDDEARTLVRLNEVGGHSGRADVFIFNTTSEAYARAAITTSRFSSVNHSRHDEWFAFLRIPRSPETPFDDVDDRYALEEQVHSALVAADVGGCMAGGHGADAVYVDVALEQIDFGLAALSEALKDTPGCREVSVHFLEAGLPEIGFPLASFRSSAS